MLNFIHKICDRKAAFNLTSVMILCSYIKHGLYLPGSARNGWKCSHCPAINTNHNMNKKQRKVIHITIIFIFPPNLSVNLKIKWLMFGSCYDNYVDLRWNLIVRERGHVFKHIISICQWIRLGRGCSVYSPSPNVNQSSKDWKFR